MDAIILVLSWIALGAVTTFSLYCVVWRRKNDTDDGDSEGGMYP